MLMACNNPKYTISLKLKIQNYEHNFPPNFRENKIPTLVLDHFIQVKTNENMTRVQDIDDSDI